MSSSILEVLSVTVNRTLEKWLDNFFAKGNKESDTTLSAKLLGSIPSQHFSLQHHGNGLKTKKIAIEDY
jgi:hypothetical protein